MVASLQTKLDRFQELYMRRALVRAGGNISEAASSLGMNRTTFHCALKKFNKQLDEETDRVRPI